MNACHRLIAFIGLSKPTKRNGNTAAMVQDEILLQKRYPNRVLLQSDHRSSLASGLPLCFFHRQIGRQSTQFRFVLFMGFGPTVLCLPFSYISLQLT